MNPPEIPPGGAPPQKKEIQLQGPRPPPLKVSKESHKIKKPPPHPAHHQQAAPLPEHNQAQREPVIIYSVSPRIIHVKPGDFMDVVQRLTGAPPADEALGGGGEVSPAARLASIEKTSPAEREKDRAFQSGDDEIMRMLTEGVQVAQFPGILSPEPGTLAPIPATVFSPALDAQTTAAYWNEWWTASPSGFLSVAAGSPQASPNVFSLFDY